MSEESGAKHAYAILRLGCLMGCIAVSFLNLPAQSATASLWGLVTDPQGASLANTTITATNVATHVWNAARSDSEGMYRLPALPIGIYRVRVEREGFRTAITANYALHINQDQRIDIQLGIGTRTDVLEVRSSAAVVETANSTLGDSVCDRMIADLPLNGRQVLNLALLEPGVTEHDSDDRGAGAFNIAGGRADSITYLLNGGTDNNLLDNGVVLAPNPDALAEFR